MAVIQTTAIVNQIRGKLNGSQFNHARNANTLQRKAQQSKGVKGFQSDSRETFQYVQRTWKSLPSAAKAAWSVVAQNNPDRNRFGDLVVLSGYSKFIQARIRSIPNGDLVDNVPADTSPAPAWPGTGFTISYSFSVNQDGEIIISGSVTRVDDTGSDDFFWSLDVSLPFSTGVTTYYGRYSWVTGESDGVSNPWSFSQNLGSRYPSPSTGQVVEFRFRVNYSGNGSQVFEVFFRDVIS